MDAQSVRHLKQRIRNQNSRIAAAQRVLVGREAVAEATRLRSGVTRGEVDRIHTHVLEDKAAIRSLHETLRKLQTEALGSWSTEGGGDD